MLNASMNKFSMPDKTPVAKKFNGFVPKLPTNAEISNPNDDKPPVNRSIIKKIINGGKIRYTIKVKNTLTPSIKRFFQSLNSGSLFSLSRDVLTILKR